MQSGFARGIRQRLHPAMINISSAVEHNLAHTLRFGSLGDRLPYIFRGSQVPAAAPAFLFALRGTCRNERGTVKVVNDLYVNVVQRAVYIQPWPLRRSLHFLANTVVHVPALLIF